MPAVGVRGRARRGAGKIALALLGVGVVAQLGLSFVPPAGEASRSHAEGLRSSDVGAGAAAVEDLFAEASSPSPLLSPASSSALLFAALATLGAASPAAAAVIAGAEQPGADQGSSLLLSALPPEEQQGYLQNTLGYVSLMTNYMLGMVGSVFGPIIRAWNKPGPLKFVYLAALTSLVVGLVILIRGMLAIE